MTHKIIITMTGRDWDGSDIDKTYRPRMDTIISRMNHEWNAEYPNDMTPFKAIIATAMLRWYGRNAFFWRDKGLANEGIYGQVCEPSDINSNNCVTPRVHISINVNGHDVSNSDELCEYVPEFITAYDEIHKNDDSCLPDPDEMKKIIEQIDNERIY